MKLKDIWRLPYVKAIIIGIGIIVCFGSGLWTGCGNYGEIKTELNKSIVFNEEASERIAGLQRSINNYEQTIARLRHNNQDISNRYRELQEIYTGTRNAYIKLQEGIIRSENYNTEAERLIKESIKLIEAQDN